MKGGSWMQHPSTATPSAPSGALFIRAHSIHAPFVPSGVPLTAYVASAEFGSLVDDTRSSKAGAGRASATAPGFGMAELT